MIEHVYRRAASASAVDAVGVATDDRRIADAVERFGGFVAMTGSEHQSGTDRVAAVARDLTCDVVVNVQGDLPLITPEMIAEVVSPFERDPAVLITTLRTPLAHADLSNPNVVKVVIDRNGDALYFSRAAIPFPRGPASDSAKATSDKKAGHDVQHWKHIGLYAYRRSFLIEFAQLPQTPLELTESLEQLRALEHGYRIRTVETQHESVEVDTPDDLERVRGILATAGARA